MARTKGDRPDIWRWIPMPVRLILTEGTTLSSEAALMTSRRNICWRTKDTAVEAALQG